MRLKRSKKPTNKELWKLVQDTRYRMMATQSQLNSLTEIISDFLDFMDKKEEFMEYVKAKLEPAAPGSVENPEVVQKELEPS